MTELFRRSWSLTIGTLKIDATDINVPSLSVNFVVTKSLKREPNSIELDITNLSPSHREEIEGMSDVAIELSAGYVDAEDVIFSGDLRVAKNKKKPKLKIGSSREQIEVITEIDGEDGGRYYRSSRVNKSYAPGTGVITVLQDAVSAMGIGVGNLSEYAGEQIEGLGATFAEGAVLYGRAHEELNRIVRSMGLTWSIQGGNLQLLKNSVPVQDAAVKLSSDTGLLGSPTKESNGKIKANALLIPELYPGRKVVLESKDLTAQAVVNRVVFKGDSAGNEWSAALELKEY